MSNYLLPDADTPVVQNGVISHEPETSIATLEPRVNGTGSVTIAGTVGSGDDISLKFTSTLFTGGSLTVGETDVSGDTDTNAAERLAAAIMANATLTGFGVIAEADPIAGKVDVTWPGPLGSFVTMSDNTTGAETFTLVQISGGSGPIIPTDNFRFVYNGQVIQLVHNRRKQLDKNGLAVLVASGPHPIM
jgi:hypothetical protein